MSRIGTVKNLWRYPVKSMRGEEMAEIFVGYGGVYGDRLFAVESSANAKGFPFFTGRDQRTMICYRPRFRQPEKAVQPRNRPEAESLGSGTTPIPASAAELMLDVETPDGQTFAIDDPALLQHLSAGAAPGPTLTLLRSDKAITDCRPLSLISLQTVSQLAEESGTAPDPRRFRANFYLDLASGAGFGEDQFVGKTLRLGERATISVVGRDGRCLMITLDPDTGEKEPTILKTVAQRHEGRAGIYAAVLVEGMVRAGDAVELLD